MDKSCKIDYRVMKRKKQAELKQAENMEMAEMAVVEFNELSDPSGQIVCFHFMYG